MGRVGWAFGFELALGLGTAGTPACLPRHEKVYRFGNYIMQRIAAKWAQMAKKPRRRGRRIPRQSDAGCGVGA